jgi:hypothetical protein
MSIFRAIHGVHVVLPLMAMMQDAPRDLSRPLNGLTRTATFTDDISTPFHRLQW